jgi:peptidoglycan/LPS O-acetylase OafA/YrhL
MQQILSIQALRAIAAGMVVFHHCQNDAGFTALGLGRPFERFSAMPWAAGVDLFFVISGFVMVFASEKFFAAPGGAGQFIKRRLSRIVPLYWLATTIFLIMTLRGAAAGRVLFPDFGEIFTSFAFIPWPRALDGAPRPIHSLGWTLEYEMFFYLVFACFLWLPRLRAVAAVTAVLVALVIWGVYFAPQNVTLAFWTDAIVLEFALGMFIALAYRRGLRLPGSAIVAMIVTATLVLAADPRDSASEAYNAVTSNGFARLLAWGVPMAALFAATTLVDASERKDTGLRVLGKLGDASYALYLFHPLALIALRKIWLAGGLENSFGVWPLVIASTLASIALSLAIHKWIERPLTRAAQNWLEPRRAQPSPEPHPAQG